MSNSNYLGTVILVILMSMSASLQSQDTPRIITLLCNTSTIQKPNTNASCRFDGQKEGETNENFTVTVKKGTTIIWKGLSTNAPDTDRIDIKSINHEGLVNVFGRNRLPGNGQQPEIVVGTVVHGNSGDQDKYKISFKVFNSGTKRNGTFHIDPKIQIE